MVLSLALVLLATLIGAAVLLFLPTFNRIDQPFWLHPENVFAVLLSSAVLVALALPH